MVGQNNNAAADLIEKHHRDGMKIKSLYLDLLAPAAKMLGEWWDADEITFTEVTIGTGRIYSIMRTLNNRSQPETPPETHAAFFATVPGDDHVLGLKMAVDLAREQGWEIDVSMQTDHDTLVEEISASGLLLIGLSAGGTQSLPNLAKLVLALRISLPEAKIIVSGAALDVATDKIELMHPDALARSFEEAMIELNRLWQSFRDPRIDLS